MGFEARLNAGIAFEQEVERYLERNPDILAVARNGTEHTHPEFVARLRCCADATVQFIRFAPDGVALSRTISVFHWEAKCSHCIERDAYETYLQYQSAGCDVLLFLRTGQGIFASWVSELPFIPSRQVVERYREELRFPVHQGWICPRNARNQHDLLTGSGTPYREIDLTKCRRVMTLDEWQAATSG